MIDERPDRDKENQETNGDAPGDPATSPADLIGAYLLDALTEEERATFEVHLHVSEAARREYALLKPVVDLLPLTLEQPLAEADTALAPAADLRDRILAAARAERPAADGTARATAPRTARTPAAPARPAEPAPLRPAGRIRPGAPSPGGIAVPVLSRVGWLGLAAAAFAVIAIAALIWALSLSSDLDATEDDLAALEQTATAQAGGVTAVAYLIDPTADGPPAARGAFYPVDAARADLTVLGLPEQPENQVYQLWFLDLDEAGNPIAARPSVTFQVSAEGSGRVEVPMPAEPFDAVAITAEPADAIDDQPNLPVLMLGLPGVAAG